MEPLLGYMLASLVVPAFGGLWWYFKKTQDTLTETYAKMVATAEATTKQEREDAARERQELQARFDRDLQETRERHAKDLQESRERHAKEMQEARDRHLAAEARLLAERDESRQEARQLNTVLANNTDALMWVGEMQEQIATHLTGVPAPAPAPELPKSSATVRRNRAQTQN